MALCPAGHESQTTDYCDTCGALMGGVPVTPASAPAAPAPAGAAGSDAGGTCPQCGAERGGRFCEECGFDYEMAELVPPAAQTSAGSAAGPAPTPNQGTPVQQTPNQQTPGQQRQSQNSDPLAKTVESPPDFDFDAEFAKAEREFAASGGKSGTKPGTPGTSPDPAPSPPARLAAVVLADREYYDAQIERGDIVEGEFPFPKYPGERRFVLDADRIRIGRASGSRGIAVEIDLTGPPLDPAVSHLHAQLLRAPDGSWSVVDLDSANGTRLNGAEEPLPAETEVPVGVGDRIHLGVWTTLILEEA
jgi:hypothetical protein